MFAYLLHVRLVCRLALLGCTVPLPLMDCPSFALELPGAMDPPTACLSLPRPWPPLALLARLARPLLRVDIWSMKEFYNLSCDAPDVFEEFFH